MQNVTGDTQITMTAEIGILNQTKKTADCKLAWISAVSSSRKLLSEM